MAISKNPSLPHTITATMPTDDRTPAQKLKENLSSIAMVSDTRNQARSLYWQGWRIARIAAHFGIKATTVHSWKRREAWDDKNSFSRIETTTEARLTLLISKTNKEGCDYKEIDLLGRVL